MLVLGFCPVVTRTSGGFRLNPFEFSNNMQNYWFKLSDFVLSSVGYRE